MFMNWGFFLLLLSVMVFYYSMYVIYCWKVVVLEYVLISILNLEIKLYLLMDWISMMFLFIVLFISSMVIFYSDSYMSMDKGKGYFCLMVLLFVFSMVMLILCPNMFMIIVGWDGLGLVSYCLVIYYQSSMSYTCGMITVMSNRVGDVAILLSLAFLMNFGSFDMMFLGSMYMICGILIILAGMTKSAQIPFSAWLPAAMAAPTPVSSLVHSSTLVTAGIYLLIRFSFFFKMNIFSEMLFFFSSLTLFMAGIGANLEMDFKKIIAFSTLSQLGMIMMILSLGKMEFAFFHLLMHAIFKSMLFLCAGLIIHNMGGIQDIRYLGNFFSYSPMICGCMGLASLSLFGFPFMGGFYSKDLILEFIYMKIDNMIFMMLIVLSTMMTIMYCLRMLYYVVWKGVMMSVFYTVDLNKKMVFPIFLLSLMVVILGNFLSWVMVTFEELIVLSNFSKIFNIILMIFVFILFFCFYINKCKGESMGKFYNFLSSMWFMSFLTGFIFWGIYKKLSKFSENDWMWMEEMGPSGMYISISKSSVSMQWVYNSYLSSLLLMLMVLMMIFLLLM
uniref:NADH dehydrogenase subunit 5 n=1 Tax=Ixodes ornithorhynchi TaxID=85878 RepID=UPI00286C2087|nr:NADH dehydrogenase subunit 5 [Ixodes ornithorhynchi]WKW95245.1 NADH dehydrogenase subunit 5 [Ixodes ornithorhynchi]WKW95258.1 NADH dehydrogenase subunit 5 [Ixodes ornithorhynchi]